MTVLLGDNTSEMVTNLLTSMLPQTLGAKTLAVTVSDFEWAEVIFYEKDEGDNGEKEQGVEDDIWVSGEDEETEYKPGDWVVLNGREAPINEHQRTKSQAPYWHSGNASSATRII